MTSATSSISRTIRTMSPAEVVYFANDRCDHENDIEQLKNGVKALRMPSDDLVSNWAYMVIAALAWNLKAWVGLWMPNKILGKRIVRMEFKRFLNTFMKIPCLIVKAGRRITYRVVGYNRCLKDYLRRLLDDQGVPGDVEKYSRIGPSLESTPLTNTHQRRTDLNHVPQFSRAIQIWEGEVRPQFGEG